MVHRAEPRSYYGRPVVKPPVWKPEVPWYFFAGGLTGASAALSWTADSSGNELLARRAWAATLVAGTVSPALLIADLGRPERFLNMLRVFKPTSPLSVGSWLLAATGSSAGLATLQDALGWHRAARAARGCAALAGLPLATYTAALLANTAVPVWHEARRELPFLFAGSAAATAGAAATAITPPAHAQPARRLAVLGTLLEASATVAMERRLGELGEPYRTGRAGHYARLAKALTLAGAAVLARPCGRPASAVGAASLLTGAVLARWAVFQAGFQSASDPRFTVGPQRARQTRNTRAAPA